MTCVCRSEVLAYGCVGGVSLSNGCDYVAIMEYKIDKVSKVLENV